MAGPERFADQISNAIQDAISSQDFSKLQSTIESSFDAAARGIGRGISQAQEAYRKSQQEHQVQQEQRTQREWTARQAQEAWRQRRNQENEKVRAEQQRRQAIEARTREIYASPTTPQLKGVALAAAGGFVVVPSLSCLLLTLFSGSTSASVVFALLAALGLGLIFSGARTLSLVSRFKKYKDRIGLRDYCYVEEIARATFDSADNVRKSLKRMIAKGLLPQAGMDRQETMVIMTRDAFGQYVQADEQYQRHLREQSMAASVTEKSEPGQLTPEQSALLARGEAYVAKIRLSNDAIPGEEISRKIDQIEHVVRLILKRASEHPEVVDDLGQLMDYYLPTTVKLLDAYRDLDGQPIQGENIIKSKREIEGALDSLAVAFEKLLDSVFRDVAWDVSADVSVLHTILAQEGLVDDPFAARN